MYEYMEEASEEEASEEEPTGNVEDSVADSSKEITDESHLPSDQLKSLDLVFATKAVKSLSPYKTLPGLSLSKTLPDHLPSKTSPDHSPSKTSPAINLLTPENFLFNITPELPSIVSTLKNDPATVSTSSFIADCVQNIPNFNIADHEIDFESNNLAQVIHETKRNTDLILGLCQKLDTKVDAISARTAVLESYIMKKRNLYEAKNKIYQEPLPLPATITQPPNSYVEMLENNFDPLLFLPTEHDDMGMETTHVEARPQVATPQATPPVGKKNPLRKINPCSALIKKELGKRFTLAELAGGRLNGGKNKNVLSPRRMGIILQKARKEHKEEFENNIKNNLNEIINSKCRKASQKIRDTTD
ncbi:uncharacterized protein LOC130621997 [Hydractinia symbiolongicarpus]|uniref:uncharacterized protein LOC130621997 n=1 Tax=Hydractinia symbiolongicarpus TaxID=13093 RepID=UPI00255051ED|nr:uncharacterized protein LOC130621997 [Hydractinia symbiolongicarpus]